MHYLDNFLCLQFSVSADSSFLFVNFCLKLRFERPLLKQVI